MANNKLQLINQMRKLNKELKKKVFEVEGGDGAVVVEVDGLQQIKKIYIDPDRIDLKNIDELELWLETALKAAIEQSRTAAASKLGPYAPQLGQMGL